MSESSTHNYPRKSSVSEPRKYPVDNSEPTLINITFYKSVSELQNTQRPLVNR